MVRRIKKKQNTQDSAKADVKQKPTTKYLDIVKGNAFADFLSKASMNGQIPELLIKIDMGHVGSRSIDVSETMLSICHCYVGESNLKEPLEIGLPQIVPVIKYLSEEDGYKMTIMDDMVAFTRKGKKSALKVRLVSITDMATALHPNITEDAFELEKRIRFDLNGEKIDELQSYLSLTGCSCIIFEVSNGRMYALSPSSDKIQFKMFLASVDGSDDGVRIAAYAKPVAVLLNLLKGSPVSFYLMKDKTTIIEQEGNFWGIGNVEL